jgi:hypothetical protein
MSVEPEAKPVDVMSFKFHPSYFSQRSTFLQTLQDSKDFEANIIPKNTPIQITTMHGVKMLGVDKHLQTDMNQTITSAPVSGDSSIPLILYTPPLSTPEAKSSLEMFEKLFYLLIIVDIAVVMLSLVKDISNIHNSIGSIVWMTVYFGFSIILEFCGMVTVRSHNVVLLSVFLSIFCATFMFNLVTMITYFNVLRCVCQGLILCLGMLIRSRLMYYIMNARSATDWTM